MDMNNDDQYSLPDLRHLMAARTHFPVTSQPSDTFFLHRNMATAAAQPQYLISTEFLPPPGYVGYDSHAVNNVTTNAATSASAIDFDQGIWPANDGGSSRWPRQETLTLLEIRSRLDSKFKEAIQKGPLWDQVSRIMKEEYGYQRSGKKCREKFENLYKYYKKTKEGKTGRHDGKHYRFFRQLEAICGESSNNNNPKTACPTPSATQPSLSTAFSHNPTSNILKQETQDDLKLCESTFSTSSEFDTSSSENNDELSAIAFMMKQSMENKKSMSIEECKRGKKSWKAKVKEYVDSQMRRIIESQDAWMEKTMKAIEDKEQERMHKEEEWRKQEEAKFNLEHEFWTRKRAWLESRDAALMDALKKLTGKRKSFQLLSSIETVERTPENNSEELCFINETDPEFSTLLQLRASMGSLGYDRSAYVCRDKWENMDIYINKKHREELRTSNYFQHINGFNGTDESTQHNENGHGIASSSQVHQNNSFQIMMNGDGHWRGNCDLSLNGERYQHG